MGIYNSKISDNNDSKYNTPKKKTENIALECKYHDNENLDPRSPNIFRTPLNDAVSKQKIVAITKNQNLINNVGALQNISPENIIKSKLVRDLGYNSNLDPRSPSQLFLRTPITLKSVDNLENPLPHIQNIELDDSFTSACSKIDVELNEMVENLNISKYFETNFDVSHLSAISTVDPRSPSLNIERTPIVLNSDIPVKTTEVINSDIVIKSSKVAREHKTTSIPRLVKNHIFEDGKHLGAVTPKTVPKSINNRKPLTCLGNTGLNSGSRIKYVKPNTNLVPTNP